MKILLAAALAVALAGCGLPAKFVGGLTPHVSATVRLDAAKALTMAYDGLDAAALVVEPAVKDGSLHGASAARVASDLRRAKATLDTADAAYHAGTLADPSAAINAAADLIAEAKAIAGGAQPIRLTPQH